MSAGSRPDRTFAWVVLLAWLPVALFAIAHHEMWRDELHCWLVARDSPWPWDVVHARRYDGQPPLWYLLLWVLEKTTHAPRVMQAVHVGLAGAVVWVFAAWAPFPRALRAAFPFGYFLAYEYVALSRCYGLAFLLVLLLCVGHAGRREHPVRTALLLAALALTTTVSTVIATAYTLVLAVEQWRERRAAGAPRARGARRAWMPIAGGIAGVMAAAMCAWPPADSTVAHVWPLRVPDDFAPTRLVVALAPIPKAYFFFWNSNALLAYEPFRQIAVPVSIALGAWLVFVLSVRRAAAALFAVGAAVMMALFGLVYGGDVRHHGFLFVLLVMAAWLAREGGGEGVSAGTGTWRRVRAKALVPTLGVVLAAHVAGTPIALAYEYSKVFSSGERAAKALREHGLDHALFVAEIDYPAIAVLGQLDRDAVAYSPRTGRTFSFVKWTRDRFWDPTDEQTLAYAARLGAEKGREAVLLMNRPLRPELVVPPAVVPVAELSDSMIEEENFFIYRVAPSPSAAGGDGPGPAASNQRR